MERHGAALHPGGKRGLVERLAAHDADAASLEDTRGRVRSRQRDDLVAPIQQPGEQRRADHARAPRDEYTGHGAAELIECLLRRSWAPPKRSTGDGGPG